jgi:nucleoside-diphosphate-sugar epimerase
MPQVLVTGATGFIGVHLVEALLKRGDRVRCLVRSPERAGDKAWRELIAGDLDSDVLARLWRRRSRPSSAGLTKSLQPEEMFRVNRDGTANLMQACAARNGPPTVVLVSSVAAAGPSPRGQVRTEADPPAPVSNYGQSKLAGERAAEQVADRVPLTIVRPGMVFGPRDTGLLAAFHSIRLLRSHLSPGTRPPPLSWIHVSDLVELLIKAAVLGARVPPVGHGVAGQGRYFATASEYPTWAEMGRMVRPMLRRPYALLIPVPSPLAWCLAGFNEGLGQMSGKARWLNYDKIREALVTSWACSGEAAKRELGFTPPKPLAERFEETIAWYRQEGWLKDGFFRPD